MYNTEGYLQLIIGPMFSGKTNEIINIIDKYLLLDMNIVVVNHKLNYRYNTNNIVTHNNRIYKDSIICDDLKDILDDELYKTYDVIIIDEFQFYKNNYKEVIDMVEKDKKIVIIASLDGDYLKQPIGDVFKLIPYCDNLMRLSALCKRCKDGTKAHFTKRILNNNNQILVGDKEYEAVCRFHYK